MLHARRVRAFEHTRSVVTRGHFAGNELLNAIAPFIRCPALAVRQRREHEHVNSVEIESTGQRRHAKQQRVDIIFVSIQPLGPAVEPKHVDYRD